MQLISSRLRLQFHSLLHKQNELFWSPWPHKPKMSQSICILVSIRFLSAQILEDAHGKCAPLWDWHKDKAVGENRLTDWRNEGLEDRFVGYPSVSIILKINKLLTEQPENREVEAISCRKDTRAVLCILFVWFLKTGSRIQCMSELRFPAGHPCLDGILEPQCLLSRNNSAVFVWLSGSKARQLSGIKWKWKPTNIITMRGIIHL